MSDKIVKKLVHVDSCCTAIAPDGRYVITGGSDLRVKLLDPVDLEKDPIVEEDATSISCLGYHPDGKSFAIGSGHDVQLFSIPELKLDKMVTRFTLNVTSLSFHPAGTHLAAAAEDGGVKIVNLSDTKQCNELMGHATSVRCLAYDPLGVYLACAYEDGVLIIFKVDEEIIDLQHVDGILGRYPTSSDVLSTPPPVAGIAWHPSGGSLAVPSGVGVTILERETWRVMGTVTHKDVTMCAWSPNGRYLAAVSSDLSHGLAVADCSSFAKILSGFGE